MPIILKIKAIVKIKLTVIQILVGTTWPAKVKMEAPGWISKMLRTSWADRFIRRLSPLAPAIWTNERRRWRTPTRTRSPKERAWESEVSTIRLFCNTAKITSFKINLNLALFMAREISEFQDLLLAAIIVSSLELTMLLSTQPMFLRVSMNTLLTVT